LLVELRDLRAEAVDVADGVGDALIRGSALRLQGLRGLVKTRGQILRISEDGLAIAGVGGIGGKCLKRAEEITDQALQAGAGGLVEDGLHLIHSVNERVELALRLRFLVEAKVDDVVANAGDAGHINASSDDEVAVGDGARFFEFGHFARVAGRVDVSDVIRGDGERALIDAHGIDGGEQTSREAHDCAPFQPEAFADFGGRYVGAMPAYALDMMCSVRQVPCTSTEWA
jgi:hypothetical protein